MVAWSEIFDKERDIQQEEVFTNLSTVLDNLKIINDGLQKDIDVLIQKQTELESNVKDFKETVEKRQEEIICRQKRFEDHYLSTTQGFTNQLARLSKTSQEEHVYVFDAPDKNKWFSGRETQIQQLKYFLQRNERATEPKVSFAAVCGLGGAGKTSLATEYAWRMKDYYQGGVYWFPTEDETKLRKSVNDLALRIDAFQDVFDTTFSKTLARITYTRKPWLIVIDDMDELHLSPNLIKLLSGRWQRGVNAGHLLITTRRKPSALVNDVPKLSSSCCLQLECFNSEEGKHFLFQRTEISCDHETGPDAERLVQELGGLPLALEQAGAYISSLGCSLSSYLEAYQVQRLCLLNEQKVVPSYEYWSPERLTVQTTWLLNFKHIRQSVNGEVAIRFVNACAFFNANEIQQELINVGEPPVDDKRYQECVRKSLGRQQVLKLLTEFSLFQLAQTRHLSIHRLVQEVILERLTVKEKSESFIDAVRMLRCAFSKCPSPDDLVSSVAVGRQGRVSANLPNPSNFYQWSKLVMHSFEVREKLKVFLKNPGESSEKSVFLPETARVVYESAVYLSVNRRHNEAGEAQNFAYRILEWSPLTNEVVSVEKLKDLFPHFFPLNEQVQRQIQYSSRPPSDTSHSFSNDSPMSDEIRQKRLKGNELFKKGLFKESIEVYSTAIDKSKDTDVFDFALLTNRASAFIKIGQYENALKDAEDFIEKCPENWKGYARKALALAKLNDLENASCAAAIAFYYERKIFQSYPPFKETFPCIQQRILVCRSSSELEAALDVSEQSIPGRASYNGIILVERGQYNLKRLSVFKCILAATVRKTVKITLRLPSPGLAFFANCLLYGIDFNVIEGLSCCVKKDATVKALHCSFASTSKEDSALCVWGKLYCEHCDISRSLAGGMLVTGLAEVQNCTASGNAKMGLEVRDGGSMIVRNCKVFGNYEGIGIGRGVEKCSVIDNKIYDNDQEGVSVYTNINKSNSPISITANRIFHNGLYGITVRGSCVVIDRNKVFENSYWGIWVQNNSWCRVAHNEVSHNRMGGIRVGKRKIDAVESIVEFNHIFGNCGPGIKERICVFEYAAFGITHFSFSSNFDLPVSASKNANISNNKLANNDQGQEEAGSKVQLCYFCRKEDQLRKCTGCRTAEYCGRDCQKQDWRRHRQFCAFMLKQSSVEVNPIPVDYCDPRFAPRTKVRDPNLDPVGPKYGKPPRNGKTFVVKVESMVLNPPLTKVLNVYDRSLDVDYHFESPRMTDLIKERGVISETYYSSRKLFLLAQFNENEELRIFINEFPCLEGW